MGCSPAVCDGDGCEARLLGWAETGARMASDARASVLSDAASGTDSTLAQARSVVEHASAVEVFRPLGSLGRTEVRHGPCTHYGFCHDPYTPVVGVCTDIEDACEGLSHVPYAADSGRLIAHAVAGLDRLLAEFRRLQECLVSDGGPD